MLVDGCVQSVSVEELAVFWDNPRRDGPDVHDAGELDIHFDGSVLPKIPKKAVLIDANGGDERDDQAARAADFCMVRTIVPVLPQDPIVLLMHAHAVLDGAHAAVVLAHVNVEISDFAQTIAPKLKRVSKPADSILAHIE